MDVSYPIPGCSPDIPPTTPAPARPVATLPRPPPPLSLIAGQIARDLLGEVEDRHGLEVNLTRDRSGWPGTGPRRRTGCCGTPAPAGCRTTRWARARRRVRRARTAALPAARRLVITSPDRSRNTVPGPDHPLQDEAVPAEEARADPLLPRQFQRDRLSRRTGRFPCGRSAPRRAAGSAP